MSLAQLSPSLFCFKMLNFKYVLTSLRQNKQTHNQANKAFCCKSGTDHIVIVDSAIVYNRCDFRRLNVDKEIESGHTKILKCFSQYCFQFINIIFHIKRQLTKDGCVNIAIYLSCGLFSICKIK